MNGVALVYLLLVLHTHIPFSTLHFQGFSTFLVEMILHQVAYTMDTCNYFNKNFVSKDIKRRYVFCSD